MILNNETNKNNNIDFYPVAYILNDLTGQESVKIKRIEGQIVFDGNPGEDEWDNTSIFSLLQFRPDFNNDPSEASEVRVGYDDQYLWL